MVLTMDIGKLMLLAKSTESLGIPDDVGGKLLYTLQITLIGVGMVF